MQDLKRKFMELKYCGYCAGIIFEKRFIVLAEFWLFFLILMLFQLGPFLGMSEIVNI